jgi:hypothetical protein
MSPPAARVKFETVPSRNYRAGAGAALGVGQNPYFFNA